MIGLTGLIRKNTQSVCMSSIMGASGYRYRPAQRKFSCLVGRNLRSAERFSLRPGASEAGLHAVLDHGAFELGEDAHHLEHRLAGWCRCVDTLLMQKQVNTDGVQLA